MGDERRREPTLTVSHEFSVLQPRPQNAYLIAEADWNRIKRIIKEIVPNQGIYQIVGSAAVGVFVSSAFALLSFALSSSSPPNWAWVIVISATVASLLMAVAFFYFDSNQRRSSVRTVDGVLAEIREIELNCSPPHLPNTSTISAVAKGAQVVINSALYGADGSWKDVTALLGTKVKDGALRIPATNAELGGDPVPNVWKTLRVVYTIQGIEYSKIIREDEILTLP